MESTLLRPGKIRKRANKACLACRARKVRCDVSQRGRPCMNCFLDSESCVVVNRASRRRKSTEEEVNGDPAADHASTEHLHRHDSVDSTGEGPEQADGDVRMEATSDGGSYEPDTFPDSNLGVYAANASSSTRRIAAQATSPNHAPQHELPHPHLSSTRAPPKQLQWAGEQASLFGSEVTYSYYPFIEIAQLSKVLPQDVSYLEMQGCLRVPKKTILDEFVKQYFLHVHPIMPIVNEGNFWETYGASPAESSETERMSLLVFQAMLFAACAYVPRNTVRALGFPDIQTMRAAFYRRVKLIFDFGAESSPIDMAQAALLLSSWSPAAKQRCTQTSTFWLSIATQQARLAGAHRYKSLYDVHGAEERSPAARKRRISLKRLWWCLIVTDRMASLFDQKPMQVTTLHFDHEGLRHSISPADFADEIERSRVYNSGAKKTLVQIFMHMTELAAVLTDLLTKVSPPDEMPQWERQLDEEEQHQIAQCKTKMESWHDEASLGLQFPRWDAKQSASEIGKPELAAGYTHESVALFTNYMCLIYQSAMVRLCHHEFFRLVAQARLGDSGGALLPEKRLVAKKQREVQEAAHRVIVCLETLTRNRSTRWLPLNSLGCISLPLLLNIIGVKLSPRLGPTLDALHDLHESVRSYQPQQDTTDYMTNSIRRILDLSGLDRLGHTLVSPARGDQADPHREAEGGLHPSLYLRLAVCWMPDVDGGSLLGDRSPSDVSLARLLGPTLISRITEIIDHNMQARRTPSTRVSVSASTAEDQAMRQRIAAWQAHDHAVSSELGFDSCDLDVADAEAARSPGPSLAPDEEESTAWHDVAHRAFSAEGDAREADLLSSFVFHGQTPGTNGTPQVKWPTQERSGTLPDQEPYRIPPEDAQDGDMDWLV